MSITSFQTGSITLGSGTASDSVTLSTTVTQGNSILITSMSGGNATAGASNVRTTLSSDGTTVTASRDATTTNSTITVNYQVIESPGFNVQHFEETLSTGTNAVALTAVDTNYSFPIINGISVLGSTRGWDDVAAVEITTSTNANVEVVEGTNGPILAFQIVEMSADEIASVQIHKVTQSASTVDTTITSVNTAKTLLFSGAIFNGVAGGDTLRNVGLSSPRLTSSTNLRCVSSGSDPRLETWIYVVEFTKLNVNSKTASPTTTTVNEVLTSTPDYGGAIVNGIFNTYTTSTDTDDTSAESAWASSLSGNTWTFTRGASTSTGELSYSTFDWIEIFVPRVKHQGTTVSTGYLAASTSHLVGVPDGIQAGEFYGIYCLLSESGKTASATGFDSRSFNFSVASSSAHVLLFKEADGTESGNITVNIEPDGTSALTAHAFRLSNVDMLDPFNGNNYTSETDTVSVTTTTIAADTLFNSANNGFLAAVAAEANRDVVTADADLIEIGSTADTNSVHVYLDEFSTTGGNPQYDWLMSSSRQFDKTIFEIKAISGPISTPKQATNGSTTGNPTITHGLTINEGDVIVVSVHANANASFTDNNGSFPFTKDYEGSGGPGGQDYAIFTRVAGASEPATYNWTLSEPQRWSIVLEVYSGVDASIWDVAPTVGTRNTGSSTTATAPSITTLTPNAKALVRYGWDTSTAVTTSNVTNNFGDKVEITSPQGQAGYSKEIQVASAVGSTAVTLDSSRSWFAHSMALKPAVTADTLQASVTGTANTTASLTAGVTLQGDASATASAAGSLTVPIELQGSASATASTTGSLTVPKELQGSASAQASTTASLTVPADTLQASVTATASTTGLLSTGALLQAAVSGVASTSATLSTGATLQSNVVAVATTQADLTVPATTLQGNAVANATVSGLLTVPADTLQAFVTGIASATGLLSDSAATLQANVTATATTQATLRTGARLQASVTGVCTVTAKFPVLLGWESTVQFAIYDALANNAQVQSLVNGVYDNVPEESVTYPYITIGEAIHNEFDTDTELGNDVSVVIHSWSDHRGRKEVKEIQNAVYQALNRTELTTTGYNFISSDFVTSQTFVESDGKTRHGVQEFRILLDEL